MSFISCQRQIKYFDTNAIEYYKCKGTYVPFVQLIWAKTTKVGCGYIQYAKDNEYHKVRI